jgi:alpha-L-rhamnosidase
MLLTNLKCLSREKPLGIGGAPYFSWVIESVEKRVKQTAYQIVVRNSTKSVIWDTGLVESDWSAHIPYEGPALESQAVYTWEVTVQDNYGNKAHASSDFETALLHSKEWKAKWVASPFNIKMKKTGGPATYFRKKFGIGGEISGARVYATCHGVYQLSINGTRADDREFAPEFTVYEKMLCVQTYDVTGLLTDGENVVGMAVGDGWYRGFTTKQSRRGWDKRHACLWQLEITYSDGSRETVCSDGDVKAAQGAITRSDLFNGEDYDANREHIDWDTSGLDDSSWTHAVTADFGYENLRPQNGEPVRPVMALPVKEVLHTPKGETVLDFGQNIAGRLRIKMDLPKDTTVSFEHSEVLDRHGNYFNNLRGITQIVRYTSAGRPTVFEPAFTFHGFRFVRITGMGGINKTDFKAVVLSTDATWIGSFECSDEKINRLVENVRWSQRSNMLSVPTDCPQREKMGWTGDMTVYVQTALLNQDLSGLITRWLESLAFNQQHDGQVPNVTPLPNFYRLVSKLTNILLGGSFKDIASSGWGDASVVVPWALYEATGNKTILEKQYSSMKAWVEYMRTQAATKRPLKNAQSDDIEKYLWDTGFHFGEWLIPSATEKGMMSPAVRKSAKQGKAYIAPVFFYTSTKIMAEVALLLGNKDDATTYSALAEKINDAFQKSMIQSDGTMKVDVQGAYVLALGAKLIPDELKEKAATRLSELVHSNGDRLDTGFLSTPYLLDALHDNGRSDLAYTLLRQEQRPGWMFEVNKGATTIWENWSGEDDEGNVLRLSFNHYAFGCVADWIYRKIGGVVRTDTAYRRFVIQPQPDERLTWAKRSYRSPQGEIVCEWKRENGKFHLHIKIPCNSEATVILPDGQHFEVGSGSYDYACDDNVNPSLSPNVSIYP